MIPSYETLCAVRSGLEAQDGAGSVRIAIYAKDTLGYSVIQPKCTPLCSVCPPFSSSSIRNFPHRRRLGHILPPPATTEHAPSAAGRPNPEQPRGLSRVRRIVCSEPAQAVGIPMGAETNLSSPQLDPTKSRESVTLLNDDQVRGSASFLFSTWPFSGARIPDFDYLVSELDVDAAGVSVVRAVPIRATRVGYYWACLAGNDGACPITARQLSLICQYMSWRSDLNLCPPAAVLRTLEVLDQPRVVINACPWLVRH